MSEIFTVGQRVRVKFDNDACPQAGKIHGWVTQGRTGTVMWIEPDRADNHRYVVGYFHPHVVLEKDDPLKMEFSREFHMWFAPWEIEAITN